MKEQLFNAIENNDIEKVKSVIKNVEDINAKDRYSKTALP